MSRPHSSRRWPVCVVIGTLSFLMSASFVPAQGEPTALQRTTSSAQADLESSMRQLSQLRATIASEKLPLTRRLGALERELREVRAEFDSVARRLDEKNLELTNRRSASESRTSEMAYLSNLLEEYGRNFESRVHIVELQRHRAAIDATRGLLDDPDASPVDVFRAQAELVDLSIDRLRELSGGTRFDGQAVDREDGVVRDVTFALIGPVALYAAKDGSSAGLADTQLDSLEPNMVRLDDEELSAAVGALVASGSGRMPFDPTGGNARKIESTNETFVEQIAKGGPVMIPILLMACAALLVALFKWVQLSRVPTPSPRQLEAILASLKEGKLDVVKRLVGKLRGPTGAMLGSAVENMTEPKELVEELMFERMLDTRLKLQGLLPFIAVSAAAAPLMGLLGTVTGIINTFKLITVYGTGDARTLSSGISEALITTKFGLIVAIPALLLHAYLARRARRLTDGMEKTAVGFLNRMPSSHGFDANLERVLEADDDSDGPAGPAPRRDVVPDSTPLSGRMPAYATAGSTPTDH